MKAAAIIMALLAASANASEAQPDPCAKLAAMQQSRAVSVALEQCRKKQAEAEAAKTAPKQKAVKLWD